MKGEYRGYEILILFIFYIIMNRLAWEKLYYIYVKSRPCSVQHMGM